MDTSAATARKQRSIMKGGLTRMDKSLYSAIGKRRPVPEVEEALDKYEEAYDNLLSTHHKYLTFVAEDKLEEEDEWINPFSDQLDNAKQVVRDYVASMNYTTTPTQPENHQIKVKTDKADKPTYTGNVIDYHQFKSDFQFIYAQSYSEQEQLYVLRRSLPIDSQNWIQGALTLTEAWSILDDLHGNARTVSDAVLTRLSKIRPVQENDTAKLTNLYHELNRAKAVLTNLSRQSDLDNSTTLASIESKLSLEDRKRWARHQLREKVQPSIATILDFLKGEINVNRIAGADIRSHGNSRGQTSVAQSEVMNSGEESGAIATTTFTSTPNPNPVTSKPCWICQNGHAPTDCTQYTSLSLEDRLKKVKENKACLFCIRKHFGKCQKRKRCVETVENGEQCPYWHHKTLHGAPFNTILRQINGSTNAVSNTHSDSEEDSTLIGPLENLQINGHSHTVTASSLHSGECGLLPVANSELCDLSKTYRKSNSVIFMDSGATISLIRNETAIQLKLKGKNISISITKVGNVEEKFETKLYNLLVKGENEYHHVTAVGIPEICADVMHVDIDQISQSFNVNLNRGFGSPDLLIGVDHVIFHTGMIEFKGNLGIRHSIIGPVLFGLFDRGNSSEKHRSSVQITQSSQFCPVDIESFMGVEEMGIEMNPYFMNQQSVHQLSPIEQKEYQTIRESAVKIGTRWVMPILWDPNRDLSVLKNNYSQAVGMLESLERRLARNPELSKIYQEQIMDLLNRNCARKLSVDEVKSFTGPVFYLTHHAVIRPDKVSTPYRIVFNSALRYQGYSLNDMQLKGPDLINSLVRVLLRFRENIIAICGDIFKMFHQCLLPLADGHLHRFIWRNCEDRTPDIYMMNNLIFGDKCSPALACTALILTTEEYVELYPEAVQALQQSRYVDDICDSYKDTEIAKQRIKEMDEILFNGHFRIKNWISNVDLRSNNEDQHPTIRSLPETEDKVLGIVWDRQEDCLRITSKKPKHFPKNPDNPEVWLMPTVVTKRIVFSVCAGIYDVLGYTAPVIVRGKIGMQSLWINKYSWDDALPDNLKETWYRWFRELNTISSVKFERCLTPEGAIGLPTLIIFSDASSLAYGAVAYFRWELQNGNFSTRFLMAKSRVAPVKSPGIPRLELNSLVVAARIRDTIKTDCRLEIASTIIFSDAKIAIAWVNSESRSYKPYVSVRVGEYQRKAEDCELHHIPSEFNVADDLTRGLSVTNLCGRWSTGSEFLCKPINEWPLNDNEQLDEEECKIVASETTKKSIICVVKEQENTTIMPHHESYIRKFSTLNRAIRVTAWMNRFVCNVKTAYAKTLQDKNKPVKFTYEQTSISGDITIEECRVAMKSLIIDAQKLLKTKIQKGELKPLCPEKNDDGIYLLKGRVKNLVSFESYKPPILPNKAWLSLLIVRHIHQNCGHPGAATCAGKVRRKYWIIGVNRIAKSVKDKCVFCKEWQKNTETQVMADLPPPRLQPSSPPFYYTAIDLFGPFNCKTGFKTTRGRNATLTKVYGVLFTCLNVRAVHIDVAIDYSTMEFLQTLRRFLAIRGYPHTLFSDQGSQLVAADTELRQAVENWNKKELKAFFHERHVKWDFFTPKAAHQNGCAESMIKTTKLALKRVIGEQEISAFELQTVLFEIMNLINQRPIGRIPNDADDGHFLSPNDLLLGRSSSSVPQGPFLETQNPQHRYEFCQQIVKSWWRQWYRDVFPNLVPRKRWHTVRRNVSVGDYVLMKDQNPNRGEWSKGIVDEVFPGNDGKVRNVKVRTTSGHYQRPITKIVVLHPVEGYKEDD